MVEEGNQTNKDLENVVEAMKKKLNEVQEHNEIQRSEITKSYEERLNIMNEQIEENIK